jgi:uncharacterized protein
MRTLLWRRIDEPGMEVAHVESLDRATGTQLGAAYELRWRLEGAKLDVEIVGGERRALTLEEGDFFDVFASPFFNSLPVMRDGLLSAEVGAAHEYVMTFVDVPALTWAPSTQIYTPRAPGVVNYRSGDFTADIEFDDDGFVVRYDGFLERVAG